MSNIVSIHGYQIQYQGNEPMVQDLELASRLGFDRPRNIRALIKRMLDKVTLRPDQVCFTVKQTPGGGRPSTIYYLSEKASLKVITKSETEKADQITDEIIDVFIDARNTRSAKRHRNADPVVQQARQASALLNTYLKAGKALGTDLPMARAVAVETVRAAVGMDFTPLLAGNSVEEAPMTPTALGKDLGLSGQKMNSELEAQGFQSKNEDGEWRPTTKGKKFCTVNPFKSRTSSHSGYQVLWYRSVLEALNLEDAA